MSKEEQELIQRLRHAPASEVAPHLWRFLERNPGRQLAAGWRQVWSRVRDEVIRSHEAPESVIATIEDAISSIEGIDEDIRSISLKSNDHVAFLLGAGASAPEPSSIPTVADLLPELWRRARKLGRDDIDRLARWCEEHSVTNIEDLLTAAYLANFAAKSPSISSLLDYFLFKQRQTPETGFRRRLLGPRPTTSQVDAASVALFQETLQGLFGLLTSTMIPAKPNPGHTSIVKFVEMHPQAAIITTNYDGCIDEAIIAARVPFSTHIADQATPATGSIDLIKMHGSINWTYCDSCHEVRESDLLALKNGFEKDTISYAVVGICKNCGGQRRPLLIPPMGLKFIMFPSLIRLWNLARDNIERARAIIVIGFSFSEADSYIGKIIERSMSFNQGQKLIVCDPNSGLAETLRKRYGARIEGFKENRILAAVGSSESIVPKVLGHLGSGNGKPSPDAAESRKRAPRVRRKDVASGSEVSAPE